MIDAFGVGVAVADAVSMALLATSALAWEETSEAEAVDTVVMVLQLAAFWGKRCGKMSFSALGTFCVCLGCRVAFRGL